ncbi:MAG: hypothetical protein MSA78_01830, partial [Solobacterium sp.]|nr:hypothetical protein [Solobacterium sp.]
MFIETETIELKKSLSQLKEGVISLSAMLNKSNCSEPLKLDKLRRFTFYMKLTYEQKLKAYQDWKSNLKSPVTIAKELHAG